MIAVLEACGLLLALLVAGILFIAMAGGAHGATDECSTFSQSASGPVEWVCEDGRS